MRLKSVSALMLIIAGLALVALETSVYGVQSVEASPVPSASARAGREAHPALGNDDARSLRTDFHRAWELRAEKIDKCSRARPTVRLIARHA